MSDGADLAFVRGLVGAALAAIEGGRRRIDDLNVYPVPDGDTGTNLTLTVRAVADALVATHDVDRATLAERVARAALLGARGNSGVILSQIVRGATDVLGNVDTVDAGVLARTFRNAADVAYRAVRDPVEGTMLSAIAAVADEAERLPRDFWPSLVRACEHAVARTPEQLDVLREAGVVDAGAAGLLELLRGVASAVTGEELPEPPADFEHVRSAAVHQELARYRYCTTFVLEGEALDGDVLEKELVRMGDSLLVVGDARALKIHVHTDDPGAALSLATAVGTIDRVEIANMHEQTVERERRLLATGDAASAVVAVVAGEGNRALFERLGAARIIEGGQTMNPPTRELVDAIDAAPTGEVIVLPNNSNVVLAAEQAARLAAKPAHVVPTRSLQEGLAAMVAFNPERAATANGAEMRAAAALVQTGEVTIASRDVETNGVAVGKGAYLGLADGEPIAGGPDFDEVAHAVVERLLAEPHDVLTLLLGADEPDVERLVERIREGHPELELDVQHGGQPHYPLLLGAE